MALLYGRAKDGTYYPVQVDDSGRIIAVYAAGALGNNVVPADPQADFVLGADPGASIALRPDGTAFAQDRLAVGGLGPNDTLLTQNDSRIGGDLSVMGDLLSAPIAQAVMRSLKLPVTGPHVGDSLTQFRSGLWTPRYARYNGTAAPPVDLTANYTSQTGLWVLAGPLYIAYFKITSGAVTGGNAEGLHIVGLPNPCGTLPGQVGAVGAGMLWQFNPSSSAPATVRVPTCILYQAPTGSAVIKLAEWVQSNAGQQDIRSDIFTSPTPSVCGVAFGLAANLVPATA